MREDHFLAPPRFNRFICYPDSFGHYYKDPTHSEYRAPGQLQSYNWHIVREGKGYLKIGDETVELQAGAGFLYGPGVMQSYYADDKDPWDIRWVHFGGAGIRELLQGRGEREVWTFSWEGAVRLDELWGELLTLGTPSLQGGEARLSAVLYEMITELVLNTEQVHDISTFGQRNKIIEAAEWIRANCQQPLTLDQMGDMAGYSVSHFSRLFHRTLGMTPIAFLTECRIVRSKILLVSTELPVKHVAERVGFSSSAYYIKRFRHSEGLTPEQFRRVRGWE